MCHSLEPYHQALIFLSHVRRTPAAGTHTHVETHLVICLGKMAGVKADGRENPMVRARRYGLIGCSREQITGRSTAIAASDIVMRNCSPEWVALQHMAHIQEADTAQAKFSRARKLGDEDFGEVAAKSSIPKYEWSKMAA